MPRTVPPPGGPATVNVLRLEHRTYEHRFVCCGKAHCTRCFSGTTKRPSHGPYWYLCYRSGNRWRRVYLGKTLDTSLFIRPDGRPDLAAIKAHRRQRPASLPEPDEPGQADLFEPQHPQPHNLAAALAAAALRANVVSHHAIPQPTNPDGQEPTAT